MARPALLAALLLLAAPAAALAAVSTLFTDCRGDRTAAPTVILEAGAFGTSADWDYVLDDLAAGGRVCAFDRAGLGRSPPDSRGRDVLSRGEEIGAVLDQLGETAPVILVGHSNGALYVEAFARTHPERVAGIVYVNGVGSDDLDEPRLLADLRQERREANLAVTAGRLGLSVMVADTLSGPMALRGEAAAHKRAAVASVAQLETARDEDRLIIPGLHAVRALGGLATGVPTVAIIGALYPQDKLARAWRTAESAPALRAGRHWILEMSGATHVSPLTRDRAYVGAAVNWLRSLPNPDVGH